MLGFRWRAWRTVRQEENLGEKKRASGMGNPDSCQVEITLDVLAVSATLQPFSDGGTRRGRAAVIVCPDIFAKLAEADGPGQRFAAPVRSLVAEPYRTPRHISTVLTGAGRNLLVIGERRQPYGGTVVIDQFMHLTLQCGQIRGRAFGTGACVLGYRYKPNQQKQKNSECVARFARPPVLIAHFRLAP